MQVAFQVRFLFFSYFADFSHIWRNIAAVLFDRFGQVLHAFEADLSIAALTVISHLTEVAAKMVTGNKRPRSLSMYKKNGPTTAVGQSPPRPRF